MKLIALTQRVEYIPCYKERRDCLDQKWYGLLKECGILPLIIPNNIDSAKELIYKLDISGFILTGGNNLLKYKGDAPERDNLEKFLIEYCIKTNKPLLGICRGMQNIQDYFGVSLEKVKWHIGLRHEIIIHGERVIKNSFHSYGAKESTSYLSVIAKSNDGVIEAIRHVTYNICGIMWHPERNDPYETSDIEFISKFFQSKY